DFPLAALTSSSGGCSLYIATLTSTSSQMASANSGWPWQLIHRPSFAECMPNKGRLGCDRKNGPGGVNNLVGRLGAAGGADCFLGLMGGASLGLLGSLDRMHGAAGAVRDRFAHASGGPCVLSRAASDCSVGTTVFWGAAGRSCLSVD